MEYRLEEIFDLQMGKTPSRNNPVYWDSNDNKWISIADLSKCGKYITDTKEYLSDVAVKESGISLIPTNTVVMSFKLSIGKTAITAEPMYSNEAIMSFKDRHIVEMLPDYVYYLFLGKDWDAGTNKAVMGKTLNKATLSKVRVNIHSIDKQREIVSVLDKISNLIEKRNAEIDNLDTLIKARFVEMFGDNMENKRNFPIESLDVHANIVSGITKGRKTKELNLTEVPYMAVSNVKDGYIDWTTVKTILATSSEIEQYRLQTNDVLMTEGGDPDKLGRGALLTKVPENCIHQNHIFRVRLDSRVNPVYFEEYLQTARPKRYFLKAAKQTTGIASINMTQLRHMPLILPPMEEQKEFADFVHRVDKSKVAVQKALDEPQTLFDSLMQEYFG